MLIATMIALLYLGSGAGLMMEGVDQTHDRIKSEIADDDTRKAALAIVDRMEDTTKEFADIDADSEKGLRELIHRYETTTADLQTHLDATYQQRISYQQAMLSLRFELKDGLSREQWESVFGVKER
jgi:hypothetical protein